MSRVWLITGASSGLGFALASAALAAGDSVVGVSRRASALTELDSAYPGRVSTVALDVTDASGVAEVARGLGRVDVLVNCAGQALIGAAEETTSQELRDLMDLHFFSPVALTQAVLPGMRSRGSGAIVQISSMGGRMSFAGVSAYSATKFALEGWSEALAAEVSSFGIRVLIVEPGAFRTGLQGSAMRMTTPLPEYEAVVGPVRKMQSDYNGTQPGDPAKAAAAVLAALESPSPPLRLVLGPDAAEAILAAEARTQAEFLAWEPVTRGTDL
ncbi:Rossmann-fold NAD(P)-binding domain-containing protein [Flindersiella endophytica]